MTKKKFILHIGQPKTGTTALQYFLATNRPLFIQNGIYLPSTAREHMPGQYKEFVACFRGGQIDGLNIFPTENDRRQFIASFKKEIESHNTILVSAEALSLLPDINQVQSIKDTFEEFEFHIVIYFRRQDQLIMSNYNEGVKHFGFSGDLEGILHEYEERIYYFDYWIKVFGVENITLIPYEKDQLINKNIIHDFMNRILNIPLDDSYIIPERDVNTRLSPKTMGFAKEMMRRGIKDITPILPYLFKVSESDPEKNASILSCEKRQEILNRFRDYNQRLSEIFKPDSGAKLFKEPEPVEVEAANPTVTYTEADALDVAAAIINELIYTSHNNR